MGADEIRQRLLGKFRDVVADRVERLVQSLSAFEDRGGDELKADIARELHTLKGEAHMMAFAGLAQLAHACEDLLAALPPTQTDDRAAALRGVCQAFPSLLDEPAEGGTRCAELCAQVQSLLRSSGPGKAEREALRPGLGVDRSSQSIRVDVDRLDEIAAMAGDLLVDGAKAVERTREIQSLFARWSRLFERLPSARAAEDADRVEGDLHLLRADSFRFLRRHVDAVTAVRGQLERLAGRVADARLVPLAGILAGFPRAAVHLARDQGKELDCQVHGAEAGVDKAVLLTLNDPLIHLLRNCVDHGIEAPEDRERSGKPRAGRVTISARPDGDLLAVTVEDDGRGIDVERVRAVAARRGLLSADRAERLPPRELLDLVFQPGFTTRENAGEISGRGLGLDVVKKKLTALGGTVSLESEPGRFTRFTLRLPQTLSLVRALWVRVGKDIYGLPVADVGGVKRVASSDVKDIGGVRSLRYRGRLLPLAPLTPLLGLGEAPRSARPLAVFLWNGSEGAALLVDGLAGAREVAVKAPGAFLRGMRFLSGGTLLPDGRVAILLSTADVVESAYRFSGPDTSPPSDRLRLRVLLVDDSTVAREVAAALLRGLGHEVEEAADGEEGWRRLQQGGFQLLLTDVRMPVLDGVDLTRRVKASERFRALPVVILSSLAAPEERRRGVDAGADAYLVKGELDREILAETLERLCGAGS